jgi:S1-C subfamily serine protease
MTSHKNRFRFRSCLSIVLSAALILGTVPSSIWAIPAAEENSAGKPLEQIPQLSGELSLAGDAGIGLKMENQGLLPETLIEDSLKNISEQRNLTGFVPADAQRTLFPEEKAKNISTSQGKKEIAKGYKPSSFEAGFRKIQKSARKAFARKSFSASKTWLDHFFGEKGSSEKPNAEPLNARNSLGNTSQNLLGRREFFSKTVNSETPIPAASDSYGGPSYKKMSLTGQILYGLKWGLIMQGISHLMLYATTPILNSSWVNHLKLKWLLGLSPDALQKSGRAELLIHDGPNQIIQALTTHASSFLSWGLFSKAALEEIHYRGLLFGGIFLAAALARPVFSFVSQGFSFLPDFFSSLKNRAPAALKWLGQKITSNAFFIASAASSILFVKAHIAAWGIHPLILAQLGVMGIALSFVIYRSRSLISSTLAHYVYNFLWLLGTWIFITHTASPAAFKNYETVLGVSSLGVLGFQALKGLYQKFKNKKWSFEKWRRGLKLLLPALLIVSSIGISGSGLRANFPAQMPSASLAAPSAVLSAPIQKFSLPQEPKNLPDLSPKQIIEKVKPAVLKVYSGDGEGLGTGYLIAPSGIALTNAHVAGNVSPGDSLKILINGIPSVAQVLAINHQKDIAILRLPSLPSGQNYPYIPISRTSPDVGEKVIALGYPYDVGLTASRGIVSRLGTGAEFMYDYVQTDASINPGNSGGPLLNSKGELIGMDVAIYTPAQQGGSVGIGFAIATDDILDAVSEYQENGTLEFAHLGAIVEARSNGQGVIVDAVRPGSAAQKAKILPGDQIQKIVLIPIKGLPIVVNTPNFQSLERALVHLRTGDVATLIVRRGNAFVTLPVILGKSKS